MFEYIEKKCLQVKLILDKIKISLDQNPKYKYNVKRLNRLNCINLTPKNRDLSVINIDSNMWLINYIDYNIKLSQELDQNACIYSLF